MIYITLWAILAVVLGAVVHELAHYAAAKAFNREPELRHPTIYNPETIYSMSYDFEGNYQDTVIALAPALAGITLLVAVASGYYVTGVLHIPALVAVLTLGVPSPSDVATVRQNSAEDDSCNLQVADDSIK